MKAVNQLACYCNWVQRHPLPTANTLYGVTHGLVNGVDTFVAVGEYGTIISSQDGRNWDIRESKIKQCLRGVAYGTVNGIGIFVAVGDSGRFLTSPDGVAWTARYMSDENLYGVAYSNVGGNDIFVVVGNEGTILRSTDCKIWMPTYSGTNIDLRGWDCERK